MRPPYREPWSRVRDKDGAFLPGPDPVVCGRKFCTGCGRWRLLIDFGPLYTRDAIRACCAACRRTEVRRALAERTLEQRELRREYDRIWHEARRRMAGVPERVYNRRTVIDRVERVFLDSAPLLREVERFYDRQRALDGNDNPGNGYLHYSWEDLAGAADVTARTLHRLRTGESRHVRLDVADRIAVAIGTPLALIYPEAAT
jgi:hypothetical protein